MCRSLKIYPTSESTFCFIFCISECIVYYFHIILSERFNQKFSEDVIRQSLLEENFKTNTFNLLPL